MTRRRGLPWRLYVGAAMALAIGALTVLLVTKLTGRRVQPERGAVIAHLAEKPIPPPIPPPKPAGSAAAKHDPGAPAPHGPQVFVPNASVKGGGQPAGIFSSLPAAATPPPTDSTVAAAPPAPAVSEPPDDPAVTLLTVGLSDAEKTSVKEALLKFSYLYDSKTLTSLLYRAHAEDWHQRADPRLQSADWPEHLAEQCAGEVKAYLQPGFLSRSGDFSVLPEETFADYHVRRAVMKEFNGRVYQSDQRNIIRHPESVGAETPLGKALQEKAAYLRQHQPVFFQYPDWPEKLTEACLQEKK